MSHVTLCGSVHLTYVALCFKKRVEIMRQAVRGRQKVEKKEISNQVAGSGPSTQSYNLTTFSFERLETESERQTDRLERDT